MVFPTFFIISLPQENIPPVIAAADNIFAAYHIPVINDQVMGSISKLLTTQASPNPFCLCIELNELTCRNPMSIGEMIDLSISLTFHYKYLNFRFATPFIIFKVTRPEFEKYLSVFQEKYSAQGYAGIEYAVINKANEVYDTNSGKKIYSLSTASTEKNIRSQYFDILQAPSLANTFLFIFPGQAGEISHQMNVLQEETDRLSERSPQLYHLLQDYLVLQQKNNNLLFKIGGLQQRLDSQASYSSFYNQPDLGYGKKIKEIVDFYHYEYEILPLWYKRFGHVIKALMGKRTLKSLFNDNVKKYKD